MTAATPQPKSRSSSTSSRNDLFSVSWTPEVPPPNPLRGRADPNISRRASLRGVEAIDSAKSLPESPTDRPTPPAIAISPRTSSFFDSSAGVTLSPTPAPRLVTTASSSVILPLNLPRTPSLRSRLCHPLPVVDPTDQSEQEPLSPLHQSPSLSSAATSSSTTWQPPLPPTSEDVNLRFEPSATYLLGEGRYARVYLASYKREWPGDRGGMIGRDNLEDVQEEPGADQGRHGGDWRLCAAKYMSSDRDAQTMGLREAFFLNRLNRPVTKEKSRSPSPLQSTSSTRTRRHGSVYIVKLIAVKEERELGRRFAVHGRTASDVKAEKGSSRQRSSTSVMAIDKASDSLSSLASSPSLPALAQTAKATLSTPSLSRWVLLLELAPLGTIDRLLRTSPHLVGRRLWERWAVEGAHALEWVHSKGIVHADVKPGNLLVRDSRGIRLIPAHHQPAHPPL